MRRAAREWAILIAVFERATLGMVERNPGLASRMPEVFGAMQNEDIFDHFGREIGFLWLEPEADEPVGYEDEDHYLFDFWMDAIRAYAIDWEEAQLTNACFSTAKKPRKGAQRI